MVSYILASLHIFGDANLTVMLEKDFNAFQFLYIFYNKTYTFGSKKLPSWISLYFFFLISCAEDIAAHQDTSEIYTHKRRRTSNLGGCNIRRVVRNVSIVRSRKSPECIQFLSN